MELNEYQEKAMTTCMESSNNYEYMSSNLIGEIGEFNSKVAKAIRKGIAKIKDGKLVCAVDIEDSNWVDKTRMFNELMHELKLELGDVHWQLVGLEKVLGFDSESVCQENLDKLASRKTRGVIDGNGDFR